MLDRASWESAALESFPGQFTSLPLVPLCGATFPPSQRLPGRVQSFVFPPPFLHFTSSRPTKLPGADGFSEVLGVRAKSGVSLLPPAGRSLFRQEACGPPKRHFHVEGSPSLRRPYQQFWNVYCDPAASTFRSTASIRWDYFVSSIFARA